MTAVLNDKDTATEAILYMVLELRVRAKITSHFEWVTGCSSIGDGYRVS